MITAVKIDVSSEGSLMLPDEDPSIFTSCCFTYLKNLCVLCTVKNYTTCLNFQFLIIFFRFSGTKITNKV